jgi:hypothetical protein
MDDRSVDAMSSNQLIICLRLRVKIKTFLETCVQEPANLLRQNCHWSAEDPLQIHSVAHHDKYVQSLFLLFPFSFSWFWFHHFFMDS